MLTVRAGSALGQKSRDRAAAIAAAVRAHPLAGHLDGTIIIGPMGAGCLAADDPSPVVMVLVDDPHAGSPLARALIRRADALVVAEAGVPRTLLGEAGTIPIVLVDASAAEEAAFLRGVTADESQGAWAEVQRHQALAKALDRVRTPARKTPSAAHAAVAEAVAEAVVATGHGYTRPMERPAG